MSKLPKNILVIRLSAMGDVAMTVPVLSSLSAQYELNFIVLTTKSYAPMFTGIPNLKIFAIDKSGRHKGIAGLFRLFLDLKKEKIHAVADLHDVVRSQVLRSLFALNRIKVAKIDKERGEKARLISDGKNKSKQLTHSVERYKAVFEELGFNFELNFSSIYPEKPALLPVFTESFGLKQEKWIGIAPFAKHKGKIYPLEKMEQVIALFDERKDVKVFLFGSGVEEMKTLTDWNKKYTCTKLMPDKVRLAEELNLMAHLDAMISMDSANMHLASLVGLPVISVWGATHYFAGFLGWKQSVQNIVEVDLECRPCSIYGNKPCERGDYACMSGITTQQILEKTLLLIGLK